MKVMIVSDIHGSAYYARKMKERLIEEKIDELICLGDILYHGPRNDLPKEYNPKEVIEIMNDLNKDYKIIAVRGNCDAEVDQMVLDFKIMDTYKVLNYDGINYFISHGHIYNETNYDEKYEVLINGHTHVHKVNEHLTYTYINPGSISIPKENDTNSYLILEDKKFYFKDLDGNIYLEYEVKI